MNTAEATAEKKIYRRRDFHRPEKVGRDSSPPKSEPAKKNRRRKEWFRFNFHPPGRLGVTRRRNAPS